MTSDSESTQNLDRTEKSPGGLHTFKTEEEARLYGQTSDFESDEPLPQLGEFEIREVLGRGGFGTVYLAFDITLQREVALKIPHRTLVSQNKTVAEYLREARATASLDHPNIIPVYRAASTDKIPCYIVTKRIRGSHFGLWLQRQPIVSYGKLAKMLAKVAEALDYAHRNKLVHRDVKPNNILVDENDQPFVADFGLALRDVDVSDKPVFVGTPAYMSPEQARGEGHRVDGRSDVFSLGTILYEVLTGKRPFTADTRQGLLQQIQFEDPLDPLQLNRHAPHELARICMKALSKSIKARYQTAEEMARDLLAFEAAFLAVNEPTQPNESLPGKALRSEEALGIKEPAGAPVIVPKGLRAFDRQDSEFFLQLLPGPWDRNGDPEILQFWLNRLGSTDAELQVPVGLIYGPSGCGKTSLARAGIIPRIPKQIDTIYIQASPKHTEEHLSRQLAQRFPDLVPFGGTNDLVQLMTDFRRRGTSRCVIFIDQFEQWLFAHPDSQQEALTQALRQCDGTQLQSVLMVRDDFWMGITRLMQHLEITVAENVNSRAVDLFDLRHARHVFSLFGIAHGQLPESRDQWSAGHHQFVESAIKCLATDGRVICVQLALLAEMLKFQPWDRASSLFDDGGASIGTRFLEETFDSDAASRRTRVHCEGACRVLRALLPETAARIKGAMLTTDQLFEASGYREPAMFQSLLTLLDSELHLITPTDRNEDASQSGESSPSDPSLLGYQITHDFLIAPIRQWIEVRTRTTKEGKAKLRLAEFAALYQTKPRPQSLPSLMEFLEIRIHTQPSSYTDSQERMMQVAQTKHLRTALMMLSLVTIFVLVGLSVKHQVRTISERTALRASMDRLLNSAISDSLHLGLSLMSQPSCRKEALELIQDTERSRSERVRAAVLIHDREKSAQQLLTDYALACPADELVPLTQHIDFPFPETLARLRTIWSQQTASRGVLLRTACLLADSPQHRKEIFADPDTLMRLLEAENPAEILNWAECFREAAPELAPRCRNLLAAPRRTTDSLNVVNLLISWSINQRQSLLEIVPFLRPAELLAVSHALQASLTPELLRQVSESVQVVIDAPRHHGDPQRPWGSPWWWVGDREPITEVLQAKLPDDLSALLDRFESVVGPHAILSHRVPQAEAHLLIDQLAPLGYRIASIHPLYGEVPQQFLLQWLRDGAQAEYSLHASSDEIKSRQAEMQAAGFIPDQIVPWVEDQQCYYNVVWIKPPPQSQLIEGDLYLDLPEEVHETQGWRPLAERRLNLPRCNVRWESPNQSPRYTSVRWRFAQHMGYHDQWSLNANEFKEIQARNTSTQLVSLHRNLDEDGSDAPFLSSAWWQGIPLENQVIHFTTRREHLRETKRLFDLGFYPVGIDVTPSPQHRSCWVGSVWARGQQTADAEVLRSHQIRNLAFLLLMLGDSSRVEQLLGLTAEPENRGALVPTFAKLEVPIEQLLRLIQDTSDLNCCRASLWGLALYPPEKIADANREKVSHVVQEMAKEVTDPGVRSALSLLADRWHIPGLDFRDNFERELESVAGDRLVIIRPEPVTFIGSPAAEPGRDDGKEPRIEVVMDHDFAIATHEVTVKQYRRFRPEYLPSIDYAPSEDSPAIDVSWYDALAYCRWLSEQEGIPEAEMCIPPLDQIKPSMVVGPQDYNRLGYRLPTEIEWEYACRGGVPGSRWFGFDPELLKDYAWTAENSGFRPHPVGKLLPNDYGLFDILGNAMEWCFTSTIDYPRLLEKPWHPHELKVLTDGTRVATRGGAVLYQPLDARSAQRNFHRPDLYRVYLGFRVARTMRRNK